MTWLTRVGSRVSSVWHSTVRKRDEEADLPTTMWVRAGFGGEHGDVLMLLEEQERVLNFLKAALNEDSAAAWSFLSSLFESDLFGVGEGMSRSDSKLRSATGRRGQLVGEECGGLLVGVWGPA